MPGYPWSPVEEIVLRGYYPSYPVSYFDHLLPRRTASAIRTKARRMGVRSHNDDRQYYVNDYYFASLTPEKCYWGGFLAADGCVGDRGNVSLKLHKKDACQVIALRNLLAPKIPIKRSEDRFVGVYINSGRIAADLKRHFNIVPRKSLILQPPNIEQRDLVVAYIAGYFDGDGHFGGGYSLKFIGTFSMMHWIKDRVAAVNSTARVLRRNRENSNQFHYIVGLGRVENFVKEVMALQLPLLDRKWAGIRQWYLDRGRWGSFAL